MNSQKMFWISGAATLAVALLIGGALLARTQRTAAQPSAAPALRAALPLELSRHHQGRHHDRHRQGKAEEDDD